MSDAHGAELLSDQALIEDLRRVAGHVLEFSGEPEVVVPADSRERAILVQPPGSNAFMVFTLSKEGNDWIVCSATAMLPFEQRRVDLPKAYAPKDFSGDDLREIAANLGVTIRTPVKEDPPSGLRSWLQRLFRWGQ